MTSYRDRLLHLMGMIDSAPFDLGWLREQLQTATPTLTESEARDILRWTLAHLHRAEVALSTSDEEPLTDEQMTAHQAAIDWLATARSVLADHSLN
jgi:hypothetical protein